MTDIDLYSIVLILLAGCCVALGWHLRTGWAPQPARPCASSKHLAAVERRLNMKLKDLAAQLTTLAEREEKILAEVRALKETLQDVDLPPEATQALERLGSIQEQVDAENPDGATPEGSKPTGD